MSVAAYHPFLLERIRADGLLQMAELFAADEVAVSARVLHTELIESALLLSDERVTAARLEWWQHTLLFAPERHPLSAAALAPLLAQRAACAQSLVRVLRGAARWPTPASVTELWQQALQLAQPIGSLTDSDPATLAAHGLLFRLRAPPAGLHNPGLCPLDLRARHQIAQVPDPAQWPLRMRQDWVNGVATEFAQTPPAAGCGRFDRTQRALLSLELGRGARRATWRAATAGRGLRALWTAWRAALR